MIILILKARETSQRVLDFVLEKDRMATEKLVSVMTDMENTFNGFVYNLALILVWSW